jgi:hypothetical protein
MRINDPLLGPVDLPTGEAAPTPKAPTPGGGGSDELLQTAQKAAIAAADLLRLANRLGLPQDAQADLVQAERVIDAFAKGVRKGTHSGIDNAISEWFADRDAGALR